MKTYTRAEYDALPAEYREEKNGQPWALYSSTWGPVKITPTIHIESNGSHCLGDKPDSIEDLLKMLGSAPLNRLFEAYGNFYSPHPCFCDQWGNHNHTSGNEGLAGFFGNFFSFSHVFRIFTDDPELIRTLRAAIEANQQRADYLSQPEPTDYQHPYSPDCNCTCCMYEKNKATCPVCNPAR